MLHPTKYAAMLAEKMQKHGATGWLVNTGWSGGRYTSSVGLVKWYSEQCYGDYKRDFYLELPFLIFFFSWLISHPDFLSHSLHKQSNAAHWVLAPIELYATQWFPPCRMTGCNCWNWILISGPTNCEVQTEWLSIDASKRLWLLWRDDTLVYYVYCVSLKFEQVETRYHMLIYCNSFAAMVWATVSSWHTPVKLSMPYTQAPCWRQITRRLKCSDLIAQLK